MLADSLFLVKRFFDIYSPTGSTATQEAMMIPSPVSVGMWSHSLRESTCQLSNAK